LQSRLEKQAFQPGKYWQTKFESKESQSRLEKQAFQLLPEEMISGLPKIVAIPPKKAGISTGAN